ncbi:D-inositol-3-phosphate glycosyltransferase [Planctomycetes bacterium CA13]|uniref:D-inositol-3-phosphate glycosyltransferase n=1 Tax=Novipirellula herctigrandis TaxID=2527986 RepID=A0A5C5Z191_9BACT|nr:D-inositol-3-phosphate glycosyltransferase [Planctomycetes bacterium CA13]
MIDNKVLFLAYNFPPAANVGVFRALRFVKYLPAAGWEPIVLTSEPESHQRLDPSLESQIPDGIVVKRIAIARIEDVAKQRIRGALSIFGSNARNSRDDSTSVATSNTSKTKESEHSFCDQIKEALFAIPDRNIGWKRPAVAAALELVQKHKPAVIYATAPPFSTLVTAAEVAKRTSLPLVLDFRDPWTRVPWGPRNKSRFTQGRVIQLEKKCVSQASRVILNTSALECDFVNHYGEIPPSRFTTITNGYDNELKKQVEKILSEASSGSSEQDLTVLHPGGLYRRRDPRPILHAIALLKDRGKPVVFEQLGHCDAEFGVSELAAELGITESFRLDAAVSHNEMLHRMASVDAFLLVQPDTAVQVPGKLFEMMLFQKPIIALTGDGALADIVRNYSLGCVADPNDPASIATALEELQKTQGSAMHFEKALHEFDGEKLTHRLAEQLSSVVTTVIPSRQK